MKIVFVLIISAATSVVAYSQNIDAVTSVWHGAVSTELHSSTPINIPSKITVTPNSLSLEREASSLTFSILSREGKWANIAAEGSIILHISYGNLPGRVEISRTAGIISITLNFTETSPDAMNQRINVDTFEVLPQ